MIAQETQEDFEDLHSDFQELLDFAGFFNNDAIVLKMKKIVPEFKSMNSTFEILENNYFASIRNNRILITLDKRDYH